MLLNCLQCNNEFEFKKSIRIKFCSQKCYKQFRIIGWKYNKEKIIELYKQGYGVHSIERMMDGVITHDFLHRMFKELEIKHENSRSLSKVMINLQPSEDLFYILGCCESDASVYYSKHHQCKNSQFSKILLDVKDKDFADYFYKSCKNIGLKPLIMTHKKPLFNQGFCWRVESNSKHFVEWYYNNKPSWNDLLNVDEELKIAFIRGVFDGDGSNHKNKQIKISTMRPEFADFLQKMIRIIGFNCNIYKHISTLPSYKKSGIIKYCYDLTILGGKEACHNFLNTINSSIERKRFKIEI